MWYHGKEFQLKNLVSFFYKPEVDTKKSFFLLVNVSETIKTLSFNFFRFQTWDINLEVEFLWKMENPIRAKW